MEYFDELSALFEGEDGELFMPKTRKRVSTADDRLIESFGKISQFVSEHGRRPRSDSKDINEAILATQLGAIRADKNKAESLEKYDKLKILELEKAPESLDELFSNDDGMFGGGRQGIFNVSALPQIQRIVNNHDGSARREKSENFDTKYKHLFTTQQQSLASGDRKLTPFHSIDQLVAGGYYIYDGMMCFVESFGETERKAGGYSQQRIHVIFENGTESRMYRRSLAQRLYEGGSVIVDRDYLPEESQEKGVGRIYILKSLSEDLKISSIANLYKIGVTNGSVENRIKNASSDPTYLMAPVKVVENYRLTGEYNPQKLEHLIHQIFSHAQIDLEIVDKDGNLYHPQEWYSVPISVVNEAIDLISTGEIVNYHYDNELEKMVLN